MLVSLALPAQAATAASQALPAKAAAALVSDPASPVNPFIGTTNGANDFPGADVPFGMVRWSPDTPSRPPGGGYEYHDSLITGFSLTHLSGPGCGAEGDIPVLPTTGSVNTSATDSFSHSNESASAGDYKVALANGVTTELTTTTRTGMARFTFPSTTAANLIFKLAGSQQGDSATSLLHPNVVSDDNGQYIGTDRRVHTIDPGHSAFSTNLSGWDIYRTQGQLEALVDPAVASDTAQSMVDDHAQGGMLPKWMLDNGENETMVGDPADPIIADYHAFGATNFDTSAALTDMINEATNTNNIRPGLNYLNAPGYLPHDGSYGCCNFYGPVSTTLEDNTADFAISAFAGALGNTSAQQTFANRAQDWRDVLNPYSGFDQPRNANGSWTGGFDPTSGNDFVEADSWIYTGMVPFNLAGLAAAKGGNAAMNAYLDTVLRSYTGRPYQTQATVRQIQNQIWSNTPGGLADGNDDLGTMSAWFVWSALGMYPMTPGTADPALGSPMSTQAVITLPSGHTLTINGNGAAGNAPYVQSASPITSGVSSGLCIDDRSASTTDRNPVQIYGCNSSGPQSWTIATDGTLRVLGKCLDVTGGGTANGTLVELYTCNGGSNQQWILPAP